MSDENKLKLDEEFEVEDFDIPESDTKSKEIIDDTQDINKKTDETVEETKTKGDKKKKDKRSKKEKYEETSNKENIIEKKDKILYIISDRPSIKLVQYARECGLQLTNIFDKIDTIRAIRLTQFNPARIAIIDSGTGKFVTPTIRKDLIDLIGTNDDEDTAFTVFYTDPIIKSDTIAEIGDAAKSIEWVKYSNTMACIATLLSHEDENYIIDDKTTNNDISSIDDSILRFIGEKTPDYEPEKLSKLNITPEIVKDNIGKSEHESLLGFEVKM